MKRISWLFALGVLSASVLTPISAPAFSVLSEEAAQSAVSSRWETLWSGPYRSAILYHPSRPRRGALWVFLHGCNQSVWEFAGGTRVAEYAEREGAYVLLPVQGREFNSEHCWNWFVPANQWRSGAEPAWIAGLIRHVVDRHRLRRDRVGVAGFSAGAAMTNILASCYPELFVAAGMVSGVPFRSAATPAQAGHVLRFGTPYDPVSLGNAAYDCGGRQGRVLPALVLYGTQDTRVNPINSQQLIRQLESQNDWADNGRPDRSIDRGSRSRMVERVPFGFEYEVADRRYEGGRWLREVRVSGLGHSWSGGDPAYLRTDSRGPDATALMIEFFRASETAE